ncbi:MAG: NAD-dependent protein deacylase [Promicromonosporaceae bacterium]|nr:NAD-dependent protein deacylase [Promicromonosporaceae bacterium]
MAALECSLADVLESMRRGVFFGGAGVSTESGIPDFRSEAGRFRARQAYGHQPEELLSIDLALAKPELFHRYYRENLVDLTARPNPAHQVLAALEDRGRLSAIVTQNIDGLHQAAGSHNVLELHGSSWRHHCVDCDRAYALEWTLDPVNCRQPAGVVPTCVDCGSWVRPDVVLYGESLPEETVGAAIEAICEADVLIVGGTSLAVYPAAGLVQFFQGETLVVINLEPTALDASADLVIAAPIGQTLASAL